MKKALLVGLNDYPGTVNDLSSCLNDIAAWRSLLMEKYRFTRENIRLLVNERATKKGVVDRLKWLKENVKDGDTLVFIYSGHGSTFTERDGLGFLDEAKDEALCLYDSGDWSNMLIDDELSTLFDGLPPKINLTFVCDSCFSGGMDKAFIMETSEMKLAQVKYLPPPLDIAHRDDPFSPVRVFGCGLSREDGLKAVESHDLKSAKALVLAACRENEPAGGARSDTHGLSVFSYYAIRALLNSQQSLTARQLLERAAQGIANAGHAQIPQMKGREDLFDKPVFE